MKLQGPELAQAQCCELDAESSEGVQLGMRGGNSKNPVFEFEFQTLLVQANAAVVYGITADSMPQRSGAELIVRCALTRLRPYAKHCVTRSTGTRAKKRSAAGTMSPVPGRGA